MKNITLKGLILFVLVFVTTNGIFADDPVEKQFYEYTFENQNLEKKDQVVSVRTYPGNFTVPGIDGFFWWGSRGTDTIQCGIETDPVHVFEGTQSLRSVVRGTNAGFQGHDAQIRSENIAIDTLGQYYFVFYTKTKDQGLDLWINMNFYDENMNDLSLPPFPQGGTKTSGGGIWVRQVIAFTVTNPSVKYVSIRIQHNRFAKPDIVWFDDFKLIRRNPKPQQNYLETFESASLPVFVNTLYVGNSVIDPSSKSLKNPVPDPELPSSWNSNLGWGQKVLLNTSLKPVSPTNWVIRFRIRLEGGPANLFSWDAANKKRMPQTDQNSGIFAMQCKLNKTGGVELAQNVIINVKVIDDKWMVVEGDLTHAAASLVGNEVIEQISISCGIPGKLYYGNWYVDDIRFGFPPMVKISSISHTELAAGWELKVNPTRDCKLYLVPPGTEIVESELEAAVSAGRGFKFENLIGAFDNVIATNNLNTSNAPVTYTAIVYRNAEDFSSGSLITVHPPHQTAKYTAYHVSSFVGQNAPAMDGFDNDPIWSKVPVAAPISITNENVLKPYNPADFKATFKAIHDDDNMYFLVKVEEPKDSLVQFGVQPGDPADQIKPWLCDAVEFLFKSDSQSKGYLQALLGHGKSIFEGQTMLISNMSYIDQTTMGNIPTGNEYFYEVAIPLNEIGLSGTPKEGDILYSELAVFNNNRGYLSPSNYKLVWDGPSFQKVSQPGGVHWGEIKLSRETPTATKTVFNSKISLAPNPVNDILNISGDAAISQIQILSISGATLMDVKGNGKTGLTLNVQSLETGSYLIKVVTDQSTSHSKFIKQ